MPWYLVVLEGGPISLPSELQQTSEPASLVGFFTTRKTAADTAENAAPLAIEDALAELRESLLAKDAECPPCCVVQIRKATWFGTVRRRYRGFTFYPWEKP
jgi:hypothetical protein